MKTVYLHGKLGKRFGKKWELAVNNAEEALSAIDVNCEGFFDYIIKSEAGGNEYIVLSKNPKFIKDENDLRENIIDEKLSKVNSKQTEIHILSPASGSTVVMPFLFVSGTVASGLTTAGMIIAAVAVSFAVAALTAPDEPDNKKNDPISTKSYLINGARNRTAQGIPVPLGYGRLMVGPANISSTKKSIRQPNSSSNSNTLESSTSFEFLDLICEGPIHGFVNKYGQKVSNEEIFEAIYINNVPVVNTLGPGESNNTSNYILNEYQDSLDGRPNYKLGEDSESKILTEGVSYIREYDTLLFGPPPYSDAPAKKISHFISNQAVGEVTVSLRTELSHQITEGDDAGLIKPNAIEFDISIRRGGKTFSILQPESGCKVKTKALASAGVHKSSNNVFYVSGIATSPYQFDINFTIDRSLDTNFGSGITLTFERTSREYDPSVKGDLGGIGKTRKIQLAHVEEKISENFLYPHSAIIKTLIDGKNFSSLPERSYDVKMKKVLVPQNYNPTSRQYEGPWNGLFKGQEDINMSIHSIADSDKQWTDNPAWIFFDLLHNIRYGVGKYGLGEENVDKWQLYKIAKYCDELVETDYPIETENGNPMAFSCSNNLNETTEPDELEIEIKYSGTEVQVPIPDPPSYDYSTYEVINGNYTYAQAKADAVTRGGRLAIIRNSQESQKVIEAYNSGIQRGGYRFYRAWLGLEQVGEDNSSWTWSDGSSLTYTNWGGNNPNNYNETRGLMGWDGKHRTTWNDAGAHVKASYILEKEGVDLDNPAPTITQLTDELFISQFGEGEQFKGKKVVFFIPQDIDSVSEQTLIDKAVMRKGEIKIEERVLIRSNVDNYTLIVSGPKIKDNQGSLGPLVGSCALQINHAVVEPRFSANLLLTDKNEALNTIKNLSSIFRGKISYSGGKILAVQDSNKKPIQLFNNSNINTAGFQYVGVQKNKRITVAVVRYNNSEKAFKPDIVYEEDADGIQKFGYIESETFALGTTSTSQARRFARWVLFTSQSETETIKFTTGQEGSYLFPGSVFEVSDELRAGKTKSGRVLDVASSRTVKINGAEYVLNDSYMLLDKSIKDDPVISRVQITVCAGITNSTEENVQSRALAEESEADQDQEINSLLTPQIYRFDALLKQSDNIKKGPSGQKTIACELLLKIELDIDVSNNTINLLNHNFNNGEKIIFTTEGFLPTGLRKDEVYFVINKTRNTFQVSLDDPALVSQCKILNIINEGRDFFGDDGGQHYFCPFSEIGETNLKTQEALDQISIGASYSIKGLIGASPKGNLSYQNLQNTIQNLEIEGPLSEGWAVSSIFGYINVQSNDGWVYSRQLNEWVFLKNKITDDSSWFYLNSLGWIYLKNHGDDYLWYIDSEDEWILSKKYANMFYRFEQSTSGISTGDFTKIKNKTIFVKNVFSGHGYYFSFLEDSQDIVSTSPSSSFNNTISEVNPGINSLIISEVISVDPEESFQNDHAIRIVLGSGHGVDLRETRVVNISGFTSNNSTLDSYLNQGNNLSAFVNSNTIELINSSDSAVLINSAEVSSNGNLSFTKPPKTEVERMLESQLFRTLSVKEISKNKFEVVGLEYNNSKFNAVDQKGIIRKPSLPIPPQEDMDLPSAPTSLTLIDLTV